MVGHPGVAFFMAVTRASASGVDVFRYKTTRFTHANSPFNAHSLYISMVLSERTYFHY